MSYTKSGIWLPPTPAPQPRKYGLRTKDKRRLVEAITALVSPEGDILHQDKDWLQNALHDAGEESMLNVYLREQANVAKWLGLLNDSTIAETDGTMSAVTEMTTPGSNGYNRQQILSTDWSAPALDAGDYQTSAAEKTFGPISTAAQTATTLSLSTTSTGAGLLLLTLALSATTTIAVSQSFKVVLRWKQQ